MAGAFFARWHEPNVTLRRLSGARGPFYPGSTRAPSCPRPHPGGGIFLGLAVTQGSPRIARRRCTRKGETTPRPNFFGQAVKCVTGSHRPYALLVLRAARINGV